MASSDRSAGHVSPPSDLYNNLNEDDGCRVNHAVVRLLTLSVPEQLVNYGTKSLGQRNVKQQYEYTEHVALVLLGELVSPSAHLCMGLRGGWGVCSMKLITTLIENIHKP